MQQSAPLKTEAPTAENLEIKIRTAVAIAPKAASIMNIPVIARAIFFLFIAKNYKLKVFLCKAGRNN